MGNGNTGFGGGDYVQVKEGPLSLYRYVPNPDGTTDNSTEITDWINALAAVPNGEGYAPPGTYVCNNVQTPAQSTGYMKISGAGMYATTFLGSKAVNAVLAQRMPGEICDMTIDGGGVTTNGLAQTTSGTIAINQMAARRVRCRNINTSGSGWVHIVWDEAQVYQIDRYYLDSVVWEGPSDPSSDAAAISYVNIGYVDDLRLKGLSRTPNLYAANYLEVHGIQGDNAAGTASLVVDQQVSRAVLSGVEIADGTYGIYVNSPDCTFLGGNLPGIVMNPAQTGQKLKIIGAKLTNSCQFSQTPGGLWVAHCDIETTTSPGFIGDDTAAGTTNTNIHLSHNFGDVSPQNFAYSYHGTTWDDVRITDNNIAYGANSFASNITFTKNSRIARNSTYNPLGAGITQPSVPASGTAATNTYGVDANVFVAGGTVTEVAIGGTSTGATSGSFRVPAGQTITLTYTAAPTWAWFGD